MNIKNDYSYLFDSLNRSNTGTASGNNLFNAIDLDLNIRPAQLSIEDWKKLEAKIKR